jgi:hypothetical protein
MHKLVSALSNLEAKKLASKLYTRARRITTRRYYESVPRNLILALRSQKRTARFFSRSDKRFAIFLVPGSDFVNGGIMSICSIATETRSLLDRNGVSVAICTAFSEPRILRYTKFDNNVEILAFRDLLPLFPEGSEVLVHLPELFVESYGSDCLDVYRSRPDLRWTFNILLQNINRIPPKSAIEALEKLGTTTATVAHKASMESAKSLDCPVHYLSWWLCPEAFSRATYSSKQKLIVISPDEHPEKTKIVNRIRAVLPDHKIVEIRNMTYRQYKNIIRDSKFTFTFGEGLDGYFVESIFSGGIGMAIFSDRYFTAEYRNLDGVFLDSDHAIRGVTEFLEGANNELQYNAIAERQHQLVAKSFVQKEYLRNISTFYQEYYPAWCSSQH